jgi:hypothetical protein
LRPLNCSHRILLLAGVLLALWTGCALAADPPGAGNPEELWNAYPLKPKKGSIESKLDKAHPVTTPTATSTPTGAAATDAGQSARSAPSTGSSSSGSSPGLLPLIAVLVAVLAGGSAIVVRRRARSRGSAVADGAAPAAGAHPSARAATAVAAAPSPPQPGPSRAPVRRSAAPAKPGAAQRRAKPPARPRPSPPAARAPAQTLQRPVAAGATPAGTTSWMVGWPKGSDTLWRCQIVWESGRGLSRFRAVAIEPGRFARPRPIMQSKELRWTMKSDPETTDPQYLEAVRSMTQELIDAGWEPIDRGSRWWSRRFVSHREQPPGLDSSKEGS